MNTKRFVGSWVAAFATVFVFEWLLHGKILAGTYQATASLWRPEAEMQSLFHWLVLGQFLTAGIFSYIFTKGYEARGVGEGVRYGFLIGLLFGAPMIGLYAVAPYPPALIAGWFVGGLVEWMLAGVVVAKIYRKV